MVDAKALASDATLVENSLSECPVQQEMQSKGRRYLSTEIALDSAVQREAPAHRLVSRLRGLALGKAIPISVVQFAEHSLDAVGMAELATRLQLLAMRDSGQSAGSVDHQLTNALSDNCLQIDVGDEPADGQRGDALQLRPD